MAPGDVLYLPRGVMHEAMVQAGGEPSLHVTVGMLEPGLGEMLRHLLAELEAEEPALRAAIPTWRLPTRTASGAVQAAALDRARRARPPRIRDRIAVAALDRVARDRISCPGAP